MWVDGSVVGLSEVRVRHQASGGRVMDVCRGGRETGRPTQAGLSPEESCSFVGGGSGRPLRRAAGARAPETISNTERRRRNAPGGRSTARRERQGNARRMATHGSPKESRASPTEFPAWPHRQQFSCSRGGGRAVFVSTRGGERAEDFSSRVAVAVWKSPPAVARFPPTAVHPSYSLSRTF